ncbi:MAG: glycosyltransferase family 2 protein [Casimicrobiaceae bacterium]|nr:glycosyltransferase family 2 protein [Casimicrobiaceae bacterium]
MRTSVVLCTYNGERFIADQLKSLLAQTRSVDEILICDDGSTDGTRERIRLGAALAAGAIKFVSNAAPLGVSSNFNQGLQLASGEVCFLCDQDDVWRVDKVHKVLEVFERERDVLLVHSDARIIDAAGSPTGATLMRALRPSSGDLKAYDAGDCLSVLLKRNLVTGATAAIRRELLHYALPIPDGYWHDEWLALIAAAVGRVRRVAETLIDYRIHADNQAGLRLVSRAAKLRGAMSRRGNFHALRALKLEVLYERLSKLGKVVPPDRMAVVEACRQHWRMRAHLPRSRVERAPLVVRAWVAGGYRRFSNGWLSAVRDLTESLP